MVEILIIVLLAIVLLVLCSGGYVFFVACRRMKDRPWLEPEKLKGTDYEKYIQHIQNSHHWLMNHAAQDVYVTSHDGLKLHGLWIPAENAKGTVLLAHGYRSTMLVDFGLIFEVYHNLHLNLLVPEQRCHGKSEGKYITFGVKESRDMQAWIDYHNRHFGNCELIISGLSMGASTMMYLADQILPDNVKGIIVDCGFTSPAAILSKVFTSVTHLPGLPSVLAADLFARVFAGFSLYQKDSRKTLAKSRLPILMIHGLGDDFVPSYMTQQGYDACTSEKTLFMVEEAGHGTSYLKQPERYRDLVIAFLNKHLEGMA